MMKDNGNCCCKLRWLSLAFALGMTYAICLFFWALYAHFSGHGLRIVEFMGDVYVGYSASYKGGLFGILYGFIDGFIMGTLIAVFYNYCLCCSWCRGKCGSSCSTEETKK